MKQDYHSRKIFLGSTDIASFILSYPEGCKRYQTGEDGCFSAYVMTHSQGEVPEHYSSQHELSTGAWLKIFDDTDLTVSIEAKNIDIYYCGSGTLIYISDDFKVKKGILV